jgi:hypothetical protein
MNARAYPPPSPPHQSATTKLPTLQRVMSKGKVLSTRAKPKTKANTAISPAFSKPATPHTTAFPPLRAHASAYHYPLLIEDGATGEELLRWFEGIEEARNMPWRKKWLDPAECEEGEEEFGGLLEKRAYEVWVSEVSEFYLGDGCSGAVCFTARDVRRAEAR